MTDNVATHSPAVVTEQITPLLTREWLQDRHIVVIAPKSADRATIDVWAKTVESTILNWPDDRPLRIVNDVSARGLALTPYAQTKVKPLFYLNPHLGGRNAIILANNVTGQFVRIYVRTLSRRTPREVAVFFTREQGLAWVTKYGTPVE
jgi:hypothetical protein